MQKSGENAAGIRSALFVDFENIYRTLEEQDAEAAEQFAANPDRWLAWLEKQMPDSHVNLSGGGRRILIRRCYMNPATECARYLPYFIRSGFEVIDCHPVTGHGKNSADIYMVLDILDALENPVHLDEFIIFSGDSDFRPVLLRLRKHDRHSAILGTGYVANAYRSAADYVIDSELFVRAALEVTDSDDENGVEKHPGVVRAPTALLKRMADRLYEVASIYGGVLANNLPAIYKEFQEFSKGEHWLGYFSLRKLTEQVISQRGDLQILYNEDPWRVVVGTGALMPAYDLFPGEEVSVEPLEERAAEPDHSETLARMSEYLCKTVAGSENALPLPSVAKLLLENFPEELQNTHWLGTGTLRGLLKSMDLGNLHLTATLPVYLYDPAQHEIPAPAEGIEVKDITPLTMAPTDEPFQQLYPHIAPLAQKIHRFTETPLLLPEHYGLILQEISREVNERGYQMTRTSKTVRDRCVERGAPIARSHVNFVLTGLYYTGYRFSSDGSETPEKLGEALVQNTLNLCTAAQFVLSDDDVALVREWMMSRLEVEE